MLLGGALILFSVLSVFAVGQNTSCGNDFKPLEKALQTGNNTFELMMAFLPTETTPSNLCYSPLNIPGCGWQHHMPNKMAVDLNGILPDPTSLHLPVNITIFHNSTTENHYSQDHFQRQLSRASDME